MDKNKSIREQVEGFTDEIEGELEKHKIAGVPLTRKVTFVIACIMAMVVIFVGVIFGAAIGQEEESLKSAAEEAKDERYQAFFELLEPIVGSKLSNPITPEYRALEWLASEDPAMLPVDGPIDAITQRFALAALYDGTKGDQWTTGYSFMSFKDVCDWNAGDGINGAICTDSYVTRLQLEQNELNGKIPESLALLTRLEYVSLAGNVLKMEVPAAITLWKQLKHLDLRKPCLSYGYSIISD